MSVSSVEITEPSDPEDAPGKNELEAERKRVADAQAVEENEEFELDPKFKSNQELQDAYHVLEKKQSSDPEPKPEPKPVEPKPAAQKGSKLEIPDPATAENKGLEGLDLSKYTQEVTETGDLTDESKAELKARGIPDATVAVHVAGLKALRASAEDTLEQIAGGPERLGKMMTWASHNMDDGERKAFNDAASGQDIQAASLAMKGLVARYGASPAGQADVIEGPTGGPAAAPYESTAEMLEEMGDERYDKSQPFRDRVEKRIRATPDSVIA